MRVGRHRRPTVEFGLAAGFQPQKMVRWLGPSGLTTTAMQVLLSTIFGAYSDKREIQAALKESGESDFSDRDELWFDFLADTGDGFNPTYTTARLLRQDLDLAHDGVTYPTERGDLLVLGGDMAYPAATPDSYRDRFIGPYESAYPEPRDGEARPTMIACAGNHDWYDGLTTFLRLFCEGKDIGGWRTEQTRSYFTIRLPHRWWIMGIDLAFDFFIDEPQMAFFRREASERMQPGDKVILMTHRPSWLFSGISEEQLYTSMSMSNLQQFEQDIVYAHDLQLPLVIAGDIHHYNRYVAPDGSQQRITAGAGAAFIYPTDHLEPTFRWPKAESTVAFEEQAVYPDKKTSKRLRWGTLLAPFKNPSFVVFVGALYIVFALLVRFAITDGTSTGFIQALRATDPSDVFQSVFDNPGSFLLVVGLLAVMVAFADAHTKWGRFLIGFCHWVLHLMLLVAVVEAMAAITINMAHWDLGFEFFFVNFDISFDTAVFIVGVALLGGLASSQLFALYLFVMFTFFGRHPTHAFSSQHIADYRSFLRLKIERDGAITIYPIGVDKVPRRWRPVGDDRPPGSPRLEPVDRQVECHLIEAPIRIDPDGQAAAARASTTTAEQPAV